MCAGGEMCEKGKSNRERYGNPSELQREITFATKRNI